MTPSDIFNFSTPFISALGPAILVTAIILNAGRLIELVREALKW